jgi:hypothetical protein
MRHIECGTHLFLTRKNYIEYLFFCDQVSETISQELVHKVFLLGIEQVTRYKNYMPCVMCIRSKKVYQLTASRSRSRYTNLLPRVAGRKVPGTPT